MIAVRARELYTPDERIEGGVVLIDGGRITAAGRALSIPAGATLIEAELVGPGYIDLQINGAWGVDFAAEPERAAEVAARLPSTGVTAFLPTLVSLPRARYPALLEALGSLRTFPGTARALGVHLEGPFLAASKVGAHDRGALANPSEDDADWICRAGRVRLVTLAPELAGALPLLSALVSRGIRVALGHTAASYDQAQAALAAGATLATHLFNAMPPLHHREPGAAAAALLSAECAVALIADGVHLHPAVVQLVRRLKRPPGVVLVTDAIAAMGQPAGASTLAGRDLIVDATSARLADGTLAGSVLSMDAAVRNYRQFTGCEIAEALTAATLAPARALGLADRGRIAPGYLADLVLLDGNLRVQSTLVAGVPA